GVDGDAAYGDVGTEVVGEASVPVVVLVAAAPGYAGAIDPVDGDEDIEAGGVVVAAGFAVVEERIAEEDDVAKIGGGLADGGEVIFQGTIMDQAVVEMIEDVGDRDGLDVPALF